MKYVFFLVLSISCAAVVAQTTVNVKWLVRQPPVNSDTIYYTSSRKLMWSDFKGVPEKGSDATAITSSGFGYFAGATNKNGKTEINITVYCYFGKQSSWVIKGKESAYALNHEQHHFDITYLVTQEFVKKLKAASFSWSNYNQLLDSIYHASMKQLESTQNEYDGDTRNGRLQNMQAVWNDKIEGQLKALAIN